jgi:hypothetical protein
MVFPVRFAAAVWRTAELARQARRNVPCDQPADWGTGSETSNEWANFSETTHVWANFSETDEWMDGRSCP